MRRKFLRFLHFKISKVPEGTISPKWIQFIGWILFPINYFLLQRFDYDGMSDSVYLYGKKYSRMFFVMHSNCNGFSPEWFQFRKNKQNGIIELYRMVEKDGISVDELKSKIIELQNKLDVLEKEKAGL